MLAGIVAAGASATPRDASAQETKLASLRADAKAKPKDAATAFALGRALRRAGAWEPAKTELRRAALLSVGAAGEDTVRIRYEIARVELDQGKNVKTSPIPPSLPACRAVQVGRVGGALSHVCAAEAWLTLERAAIAEEELAAAAKVDPSSRTMYELKLADAEVSVARQAHDEAIGKLRALTAATPGRAEAWLWLGRELLEVGKRTEAVSPLRKARELDPDWPETAYHLASALPDGPEARDLARTAVAMRSGWADAETRLGELELASGAFDAARSAFDAAVKLAPRLVAAQVGLAWSYVKLKKGEDARRVALEAIRLAGNSARARLAHAEALALLGQTDDAVDTFKVAASLDDKDPTALIRAAEVLIEAKQPVKAEAHADAAVHAFPDDARAWRVKGEAALAGGDKKVAREAFKKAIAAPRGDVDKGALQRRLDSLK